MKLEIFLLVGFFLAGAFLSAYAHAKKPKASALTLARWMMGLSTIVIFSTYVSMLRMNQNWFPTNSAESHLLITSLLGFLGWMMSQRRTGSTLLLVLSPLILGILAYDQFVSVEEVSSPLPNTWIWIHILLMLVGETFFFVASVVSAIYLLADYQMRNHRVRGAFTRITSLHDLDEFLGKTLLIGFVLLSAGMACGFLFAGEFWQEGWILDPKVIFCAVTWIIYGGILFIRWVKPLSRGRRSAWLAVVGFVGVLFLAWGVDSIFPSQHVNYGSSSQGTPTP